VFFGDGLRDGRERVGRKEQPLYKTFSAHWYNTLKVVVLKVSFTPLPSY
jgi:hypothetical protein